MQPEKEGELLESVGESIEDDFGRAEFDEEVGKKKESSGS